MTDELSFEGQVAIITGSARNMGRTHALDIAARGGSVVVNDILRDDADAVVAEIADLGGRAVASYDSVATPEGGQAVADLALRHFGRIDVLIHNAGFLRNNYFEDLTDDQLEEVLGVHLKAAFYVGRPAYRSMVKNGYGRIVLISSAVGIFGRTGQANYASAKAGMFGLSNALAHEGEPHGIRVNSVLPKAIGQIAKDRPQPGMETLREWATVLDSRRIPEAVTPLVTFLASRACYVTGELFSACAGCYSRVFVGLASGWLAPDATVVTAEAIQAHFDEVEDHGFAGLIPRSPYDEMRSVHERLQVAGYLASTA